MNFLKQWLLLDLLISPPPKKKNQDKNTLVCSLHILSGLFGADCQICNGKSTDDDVDLLMEPQFFTDW